MGVASGLSPIFVEPDRVTQGLQAIADNRPVYLADVSLREPDWSVWRHRIAWLLDHHQSALSLLGKPRVTIDLSRSGCRLMYDYALEQGWLTASGRWLRLVTDVERYDLWHPDHSAGQNLHRLLHALGWDWFRQRFAQGWVPFDALEGDNLARIIRAERAFVTRHVEQSQRVTLPDGQVLAGVALDDEGSVNEICHTLLTAGANLVLIVKPDGRLSARSDASIDAAKLMETAFAGGGHARAAGGRLPNGLSPGPNALRTVLETAAAIITPHSAG
ncbi:MAG: DHHA1 domain-containing protein [Thermaerobacter sp.]|nr:DHHA1 domain-containing protein [Thermaerobacter sp.]